MLDQSVLRVDPQLPPQARRRAYSDSTKIGFRPIFRRLASPPPLYCPLSPHHSTPLETIEAKVPLGAHTTVTENLPNSHPEVGGSLKKGLCPNSLASPAPGSPPLSRYAGMVVGSPLGLGPLNGQHLPSVEHLPSADMSPTCSLDCISST